MMIDIRDRGWKNFAKRQLSEMATQKWHAIDYHSDEMAGFGEVEYFLGGL